MHDRAHTDQRVYKSWKTTHEPYARLRRPCARSMCMTVRSKARSCVFFRLPHQHFQKARFCDTSSCTIVGLWCTIVRAVTEADKQLVPSTETVLFHYGLLQTARMELEPINRGHKHTARVTQLQIWIWESKKALLAYSSSFLAKNFCILYCLSLVCSSVVYAIWLKGCVWVER